MSMMPGPPIFSSWKYNVIRRFTAIGAVSNVQLSDEEPNLPGRTESDRQHAGEDDQEQREKRRARASHGSGKSNPRAARSALSAIERKPANSGRWSRAAASSQLRP